MGWFCFYAESICWAGIAPGTHLSRFCDAGLLSPACFARADCGCADVVAGRLGHGLVVNLVETQSSVPAIHLDQLYLGWRDRLAVRDVSGGFEKGSMTALVGPNGAGKSTLIKGIMGQINPVRGHIRLGVDARRDLACMPQADTMDRSFPISVYDLVALGAWSRVGAWRGFGRNEHDRVMSALEQVGLADFSSRIIGTLSGGQLQRALFARLLLHDAQVLLLDEPFASVDRATTDDLLGLLAHWHGQGRTIIVVLHDMDVVRTYFPNTLLLAGQLVGWGCTQQVLTPDNLHLARHLCAGDYR